MNIIFVIISFFLVINSAYALREPKPTAIDKRIRIMTYNPNDVFKFMGYYGYQANIEFAEGETVDTISLGDTVAWQIVPAGRRIFIKPMEADATTNMTVITNKRLYHFELHANEAIDINDPDMVFAVKFLYPDESGGSAIQKFASTSEPDLSEPENYNFKYSISGSEKYAPIKIFDDGEFTYFQFRDKNAEIPAFFLVDPDGSESIVNYRIMGRYLVVERVAARFTLRHGKSVVCVFNDVMDFESVLSKN